MIPHQSAFSISDFCKSHDISRAYFYQLVASGLGPRLIKLGRRTLVSAEAGADWRREMEERTAAQAQTHLVADRADGSPARPTTERARARSANPSVGPPEDCAEPESERVKRTRRSPAKAKPVETE
jgi:hypothetical protein